MPHGPKTFPLELRHTYRVNRQDERTASTVFRTQVTVNWDFNRLTAGEKPISYSGDRWLGAGQGPLDIFERSNTGSYKKIGTVKWEIVKEYKHTIQTRNSGSEFKNVYTVIIRMIETYTPSDGLPQITELDNTAVGNDRYGSWQPSPQS